MCAAEFLSQRQKFSADLAEIICQELATLNVDADVSLVADDQTTSGELWPWNEK
jgi:hypothetical protein